MDLVDKLIPEPAEDEIAEGVRAAMQACAAHGITSVQDMDGSADATRAKLFRVLQNLDRRGELTVRIDLRWPPEMNQPVTRAIGLRFEHPARMALQQLAERGLRRRHAQRSECPCLGHLRALRRGELPGPCLVERVCARLAA